MLQSQVTQRLSPGAVKLNNPGPGQKNKTKQKTCIFVKINKSLAERGSFLLLRDKCVVHINTPIFCISSNFIIRAMSKSGIGYNSE